MAISGMMGKITFIDESCPLVDFSAPSAEEVQWYDEITRFQVEDSVEMRQFGHDKSNGWKDVCAGTRSFSITIDCMLKVGGVSTQPLRAGRVVYLTLYPFANVAGCDNAGMSGWAMVQRITYNYDQDRGDPISYTMSLVSKGPWTGMSDTGQWGGFECVCGG